MTQDTYQIMERALQALAAMPSPQPTLAELADKANLSEFHFQRLFKERVGVSPKKFLQHVTLEAAKQRLQDSVSVLDASYDVGLSGPGRLHDLFVTLEAMTPGDYKAAGEGIEISYGFHNTPFGDCLLATTIRGICGLTFVVEGRDAALVDLQKKWSRATIQQDHQRTGELAAQIFPRPNSARRQCPLSLALIVPGTQFQQSVWRALLDVPPGCLTTYGDIAKKLGMRGQAARAVGQAVGANPISWLIPCHRVIRKTGALSGYRWGLGRKVVMIGWEATGQPAYAGAGA